ncbi:hypothetical protein HPB50_025203 [Hyalomma asiaticum]|uniref:Uncharacterized protein n=1 Tax=Hyalomma asiaticum TaxID=266040 RepID=A0ACB7S2Q8_HYAAI|nr:hypothetical protein HPB50_025203 [Hyalomma asiaticum]
MGANCLEWLVTATLLEMPRTKKTKPRQSSLLPGCTLGHEQIRYLECLVSELECTVERNCQAVQSAVDRINRSVDMWYDNIIRTVPDEILNRPFRELWDSSVPLPKALPSSITVSTVTPSPTDTELSSDMKPLTATRLRQKAVVASAKAKRAGSQRRSNVSKKKAVDEMPSAAKPPKRARKGSMHTPLLHPRRAAGAPPIVTPKFDIRYPGASLKQNVINEGAGAPLDSSREGVLLEFPANNGEYHKESSEELIADSLGVPLMAVMCNSGMVECPRLNSEVTYSDSSLIQGDATRNDISMVEDCTIHFHEDQLSSGDSDYCSVSCREQEATDEVIDKESQRDTGESTPDMGAKNGFRCDGKGLMRGCSGLR